MKKKKKFSYFSYSAIGTVVTVQNLGKKKVAYGTMKHLFSVVIGHSFILYYFILTYKKLTHQ